MAAALKPGGRFALETPMVIESLLPSLKDRPWFKAGDIYLLVANEYDAARGRLDIEYTFASPAGVEVRRGSHRAYTYRQLIELVETAGFDVTVEPGWPAESDADRAREKTIVRAGGPGLQPAFAGPADSASTTDRQSDERTLTSSLDRQFEGARVAVRLLVEPKRQLAGRRSCRSRRPRSS